MLEQSIRRLGQKRPISNALLFIASIIMSEENCLPAIRRIERQESRLDRTCYWLITLAGLASFPIGILCLAKFATPPTIGSDQERLAGRDVPTQSIVTFGQAFQQLGTRH
jgi:hypothetical protein